MLFTQAYKGVQFDNIYGEILDQEADAIVNPTNNQLVVSSTLLIKGGQKIQTECEQIIADTEGMLDNGTAVSTTAGKLKAKYVIHAVIPLWSGGENNEEEKMSQTVLNILAKADEVGASIIAVPFLSSEGFGFPKGECAKIIVKAVFSYLDTHTTKLKLIKFVNMHAETTRTFKKELTEALGVLPIPNPDRLNSRIVPEEEPSIKSEGETQAEATLLETKEEREAREHLPEEKQKEISEAQKIAVSEEKTEEIRGELAAAEEKLEEPKEERGNNEEELILPSPFSARKNEADEEREEVEVLIES